MPLILVLIFVIAPLVELAVIMQVGQVIGVWPTVALLLVVSVAGAVMVRREGTRAWHRFREALAEMRLPTTEVVDGALVLLGGALMLTPGFVTDAIGLLLIFPVTRAGIRRLVSRRVRVMTLGAPGRRPPGQAGPGRGRQAPRSQPPPWGRSRGGHQTGRGRPRAGRVGMDPDEEAGDKEVVDIEVVSIERNEPSDGSRE